MASIVRLLLIEDNRFDAEIMIEHLSFLRLVKVQVEHATTLAAARKHLVNCLFDGILVDLNLPDSSGVDTVREVVSLAGDVPVLVLTGILDENIKRDALNAGAEMFLRKGDVSEHRLAVAIMSLLVNSQIRSTNNLESAS